MAEIGYTLSSEEHPPNDLIRNAERAEEAGFAFAMISDHYHPWTGHQGESAFVWSVIGAIASRTEKLRLGTGVTCPTMRIHPAVIAQAAATCAAMMPGRFFLGVGTGESLNEHITGQRWPPAPERLRMLEEAIEIMHHLWEGKEVTHTGEFFVVQDARIYSLPVHPPSIMVAAAGSKAAELAGRKGDGIIGTKPDPELLERFDRAGGAGKPRYGKVTVCWAESEAEARRTAHEWWPNSALQGELGQELPLPRHFEQAIAQVTQEQVAKSVVCGPEPGRHIEAVQELVEAGYDHVFVHQIGPNQEGFLAFYEDEVIRKL